MQAMKYVYLYNFDQIWINGLQACQVFVTEYNMQHDLKSFNKNKGDFSLKNWYFWNLACKN